MVDYHLQWDDEALALFKEIFYWYKDNLGIKAANKFRKGIVDAIYVISKNPYIGPREILLAAREKEYHSFIEHTNHKIIYFIESDLIYIAYIWDCRMDNSNIENIIP